MLEQLIQPGWFQQGLLSVLRDIGIQCLAGARGSEHPAIPRHSHSPVISLVTA